MSNWVGFSSHVTSLMDAFYLNDARNISLLKWSKQTVLSLRMVC